MTASSDDCQCVDSICNDRLGQPKELLAQLEKLVGRDGAKGRKWKSFRQALKSVLSKSKIEGIAARLSACRSELNLHLIFSIK
jgi:hypothetical protein